VKAVKTKAKVMSTLDERLKELSAEDRAKVEERTGELIAEDISFQRLRKALIKAQEATSDTLKLDGKEAAKLTERSQHLLQALRAEIESMGGKLTLTAEFPDLPPVEIPDFLDDLK
jgi:hypothetical protein